MADEKGFTLWFTGLSGAGKTTISRIVERELRDRSSKVEVLDGDVVQVAGAAVEDADAVPPREGAILLQDLGALFAGGREVVVEDH